MPRMFSPVRPCPTLLCGILAGVAGLLLPSPARCHDPAKNPDEVYLVDPVEPKSSHGELLIGIGDKCLDVRAADPTDGTIVQIYECHGNDNQRWQLEPAASFFELRGLAGKCVQPIAPTVPDGRTPLGIGPCGGLEDRWYPGPGFPAAFDLVHVSSDNCLDVQGASTEDRTPVNVYPCNGGPNQVWRFGSEEGPGIVDEIEPNDTFGTAQFLDPESFIQIFDPDVGDRSRNTSAEIPHLTVRGTGDETRDYYSFVVENPGERGIFDIDHSNFDSYLVLYNAAGTPLAFDDDSPIDWGEGGSTSSRDSYLQYTFAAPGLYVLEVGRCCAGPVPPGASYELQVSVGREECMVLNDNRFVVCIDWSTAEQTGPARPTDLRTDDSGVFYFFSPNNLEMLVKVLDGCAINSRYWVFFAATTDVAFTVSVTDLLHGVTATWHNELGHPADAVTDTAAFETCP